MDFKSIKQQVEEIYLSTPNSIHGVGISYKIIDGKETDQLCITFYVAKKLKTEKELENVNYLIPKKILINNIEFVTDVVENEIPYAKAACNNPSASPLPAPIADNRVRTRPLKGGVNIANYTDKFIPEISAVELGTLGLICVDKENDTLVGLTNSHVLLKDNFSPSNQEIQGKLYNIRDPKKNIVQWTEPSINTIADNIGCIKKFYPISDYNNTINYIDAALIAIKEKDANNDFILNPGESFKQKGLNYNQPMPFASTSEIDNLILNKNNNLYISSRTTGPKGTANCRVVLNGLVTFTVAYKKQDQYVPVDFSDIMTIKYADSSSNPPAVMGGDSGAVVIADFNGTWKIIGLVFAAETNGPLGFVSRIDRIKKGLNIEHWDGSPKKYTNVNVVDSFYKEFNQAKAEMSNPDSSQWPISIVVNNKKYWYAGLIQNPLAVSQLYPALGPKDYDDPSLSALEYLNYFRHLSKLDDNSSKSSRYYEIKIGNSHFFILDSDPVTGGTGRLGRIQEGAGKGEGPDSISNDNYRDTQKQWFNNAIENSNLKWKFVIFNHPPYSSSQNSYGYHNLSYENGWNLHLATAVFCGNANNYERIEKTHVSSSPAVPYFINGCGGAKISNFNSNLMEGSKAKFQEYGFTKINIHENGVKISFISQYQNKEKDFKIIGDISSPLSQKFCVIAELGVDGSSNISTIPADYKNPTNNFYTYWVSESVKKENPTCIFTAGNNSYPLSDTLLLEANMGRFYSQYIGDYAEAIFEALSSSTTEIFEPPFDSTIDNGYIEAQGGALDTLQDETISYYQNTMDIIGSYAYVLPTIEGEINGHKIGITGNIKPVPTLVTPTLEEQFMFALQDVNDKQRTRCLTYMNDSDPLACNYTGTENLLYPHLTGSDECSGVETCSNCAVLISESPVDDLSPQNIRDIIFWSKAVLFEVKDAICSGNSGNGSQNSGNAGPGSGAGGGGQLPLPPIYLPPPWNVEINPDANNQITGATATGGQASGEESGFVPCIKGINIVPCNEDDPSVPSGDHEHSGEHSGEQPSGEQPSGEEPSGLAGGGCKSPVKNISSKMYAYGDPVITAPIKYLYNYTSKEIGNYDELSKYSIGKYTTQYVDGGNDRYELLFFGAIGNQFVKVETSTFKQEELAITSAGGVLNTVTISQGIFWGKNGDNINEVTRTLRSTTYHLERNQERGWTLLKSPLNGDKVDMLRGLPLSLDSYKIPPIKVGIGKVTAIELTLEFILNRNVFVQGLQTDTSALSLEHKLGPLFVFDKLGGSIFHNFNYVYNRIDNVKRSRVSEKLSPTVWRRWQSDLKAYAPSETFVWHNTLVSMAASRRNYNELLEQSSYFYPTVYQNTQDINVENTSLSLSGEKYRNVFNILNSGIPLTNIKNHPDRYFAIDENSLDKSYLGTYISGVTKYTPQVSGVRPRPVVCFPRDLFPDMFTPSSSNSMSTAVFSPENFVLADRHLPDEFFSSSSSQNIDPNNTDPRNECCDPCYQRITTTQIIMIGNGRVAGEQVDIECVCPSCDETDLSGAAYQSVSGSGCDQPCLDQSGITSGECDPDPCATGCDPNCPAGPAAGGGNGNSGTQALYYHYYNNDGFLSYGVTSSPSLSHSLGFTSTGGGGGGGSGDDVCALCYSDPGCDSGSATSTQSVYLNQLLEEYLIRINN